jgi:hypothetical protein
VRIVQRPSFLSLLATVFTLQLAWFMAQELTEALVAGLPADSALNLLLWGMAGQLPVAVAGAAVLTWLGAQVEAAAGELGSVSAIRVSVPLTAPVVVGAFVAGERALVTAHASRSHIVKRGPPSSSSFRPF